MKRAPPNHVFNRTREYALFHVASVGSRGPV